MSPKLEWTHPAAKELDALDLAYKRAKSTMVKRHRIREHAIINQKFGGTWLERALWSVAKWSPFGGMAVPVDLMNPYMLRTYLTPDGMRLHLPKFLKTAKDYGVGPGARSYLHHFFRGDDAEELHNHPWRISYSWILSGGYVEYKLNQKTKEIERRVLRPGAFNVLRHDDFHRVELLDKEAGCWTLFISVDRLAESDGTDWVFMNVKTGKITPWGEFVRPAEAAERLNRDHPDYVTAYRSIGGWKAVHVTWSTSEHGGFYGPYQTGVGAYHTREEALVEAKAWASDEGIKYVEPKEEPN